MISLEWCRLCSQFNNPQRISLTIRTCSPWSQWRSKQVISSSWKRRRITYPILKALKFSHLMAWSPPLTHSLRNWRSLTRSRTCHKLVEVRCFQRVVSLIKRARGRLSTSRRSLTLAYLQRQMVVRTWLRGKNTYRRMEYQTTLTMLLRSQLCNSRSMLAKWMNYKNNWTKLSIQIGCSPSILVTDLQRWKIMNSSWIPHCSRYWISRRA